jgi:coenzyme F420-reducing hydrogenase beta subunit
MSSRNINCIIDNCCGCEACYSVCPKNAIYYERGRRGELLYKANDSCINCGKCMRVCASNNAKLHEESNITYRAITRQKDVLMKSSSGGIAYEIAQYVLSQNGVVYAATWNIDRQKVQHSRIESIQELPAMQGSKYVQSSMGKDVYNGVLTDVKKSKTLFIGCPCQVSAVRNIVGDNNNLLCIDLVCHGVPSAEMLGKQLKALTNKPVESLSFRHGLDFTLDIKNTDGKYYSVKGYDNPYYSLFLSFSSLRDKCYSCSYAQRKRVGDLTIGDYVEEGKGYSCVLPNSDAGKRIIEETISSIEYEERNTDLLLDNDALNHPTRKNTMVDIFTERYNKRGLYFAYYSTFSGFVLKRVGRRIVGNKVYDWVVSHLKGK